MPALPQDGAAQISAPEGGWTGTETPATDPSGIGQTSPDQSGSPQGGDADDQSSAVPATPEQPAQAVPKGQFSGNRPTEDQLPELPPLDPVR